MDGSDYETRRSNSRTDHRCRYTVRRGLDPALAADLRRGAGPARRTHRRYERSPGRQGMGGAAATEVGDGALAAFHVEPGLSHRRVRPLTQAWDKRKSEAGTARCRYHTVPDSGKIGNEVAIPCRQGRAH